MKAKFIRFTKFITRVLLKNIFYRVNIVGIENIPREGPIIIAGNHSSLLDGPLLVSMKERNLYAFVKEEVFEYSKVVSFVLKLLDSIPVTTNSNDISGIRKALRVLKEGKSVLIFPQGTRTFEGSSVLAHEGCITIASISKVNIIPVYITEKPRIFSNIDIIIGEQISIKREKGKEKIQAQELLNKIYRLKKNC